MKGRVANNTGHIVIESDLLCCDVSPSSTMFIIRSIGEKKVL